MKKGLHFSKAEDQPHPQYGILLGFTIKKTGDARIDDLVDRLREQIFEVDADSDEDTEGSVTSLLFVFHEAIRQMEERVKSQLDVRKTAWRKALRKVLSDISRIQRYEQSDGEKGQSVGSLITLAYLEEQLQARTKRHDLYRIEPLEKLYGTPHASIYSWADGDTVETVLSSIPDDEDFALRRIFALDRSPLEKESAPLYLEKAKIPLGRIQAYLAKGYRPSDNLVRYIAQKKDHNPDDVHRELIQEAETLAATLFPQDWEPFEDEQVRGILSLKGKNSNLKNRKDIEAAESYLEDLVGTLKVVMGYEQLLIDTDEIRFSDLHIHPDLSETGYSSWDLEPRNIIFRGCERGTGIPMFTVIDQWLEDGEIDHKRRTRGGGGGILRMGP